MKYSIRQTADGWELVAADGHVVATFKDGLGISGYALALDALGTLIKGALADAGATDTEGDASSGVLTERWVSDQGIAFSEKLPGGRDFTNCEWSWRDPLSVMVPLMLLVENTEYGHLGAVLAGFCEEFSENGGTVASAGGYFDTDAGRMARDLVTGSPVPLGVSVDPTENVEVEYREECLETDDDGFCSAWDFSMAFTKYEIGGLTICPIPGFENAGIKPDGGAAAAAAQPKVAASVATRTAPPRTWFDLAEPKVGQPFLGTLGEEFLVQQQGGGYACPLQITDDGLVFGNIAVKGQCHVGYQAQGMGCVEPPESACSYAQFNTGHVVCDDGTSVATGSLVVGCEHAPMMDARACQDYYAHSGMGWADVHVTEGEYGPWCVGVLRPDVTAEQLRVLRSLSLSGDWCQVGTELELIGVLAVNTPGFPIAREAVKASGLVLERPPVLKASVLGGAIRKITAANVVVRCVECAKRAVAQRGGVADAQLGRLTALVEKIERRTRHLEGPEAEAMRARLEV